MNECGKTWANSAEVLINIFRQKFRLKSCCNYCNDDHKQNRMFGTKKHYIIEKITVLSHVERYATADFSTNYNRLVYTRLL